MSHPFKDETPVEHCLNALQLVGALRSRLSPAPKPPIHAKDENFLAWLRTQRCLVSRDIWPCREPVEAAHLESRRYGDVENAVPLCGGTHHREGRQSLHQLGRDGFEALFGLDLKAEATRLYQQYLAEVGRA